MQQAQAAGLRLGGGLTRPRVRAELKKIGMQFRPHDQTIAGRTCSRGLVVITNNKHPGI